MIVGALIVALLDGLALVFALALCRAAANNDRERAQAIRDPEGGIDAGWYER